MAVAVAAAGCGGDDEEKPASTGPPAPKQQPKTGATDTIPFAETAPKSKGTSPEDQPGGAGDEAPARAPAILTGKGGRIRPRVVRVPPFIAVRVELRSADGRPYALRFGRKALRVGPQVAAMSTTLGGLHQGEAVTGRPIGGQGTAVRIVASAEPGP
jgi:hypothetical protein